MTWALFLVTAAVIVAGGARLARYGDIIGRVSGLGGSWTGAVLLAATTSLPELFTGYGATALADLPDIAAGDVLGSCMFNLLILSLMDAVQPERLSARAHQGHTMAIALGGVLVSVTGLGILAGPRLPTVGHVGVASLLLLAIYLAAVRALLALEQRRLAPVAAEVHNGGVTLAQASLRYALAAVFVVAGALALPSLAARIAGELGLGQALVGSVLVAGTTSLPEIVVSLAAVRMGAVDLGIANVLGSNLFNLFILGLDDVFYRQGPLFTALAPAHVVTVVAVLLMYAVFLVGVTQQVATKRFRVGWDTAAIALVYGVTIWLVSGAS